MSEKDPLSVIVYGPDGMGKTTFSSHWPNAVICGPEIKGSRFIKGMERKTDIRTYAEVMAFIKKLTKEKSDYKTFVLDSLDHIELDIHDAIKKKYKVENIAKAAGGFGAGYKEAADMHYALAEALEELQAKTDMNIVLIAHSQVKSFNDPLTDEPYDRYELKLHESASVSPRAMWREMADAVFFLNESLNIKGEGKSSRAFSNNVKYLYTRRNPRYDAKCRFTVPERMPFELGVNAYKLISGYAFDDNDGADPFEKAMQLYNSLSKPDENIKKFLEDNKTNPENLKRGIIRLEELV